MSTTIKWILRYGDHRNESFWVKENEWTDESLAAHRFNTEQDGIDFLQTLEHRQHRSIVPVNINEADREQ